MEPASFNLSNPHSSKITPKLLRVRCSRWAYSSNSLRICGVTPNADLNVELDVEQVFLVAVGHEVQSLAMDFLEAAFCCQFFTRLLILCRSALLIFRIFAAKQFLPRSHHSCCLSLSMWVSARSASRTKSLEQNRFLISSTERNSSKRHRSGRGPEFAPPVYPGQ